MQRMSARTRSRFMTLLLGLLAAVVVIVIIIFPDKAFQSSLQGLTIWWELVFPALLPFLILSEILIGFGVMHAAGTLLEPLMRTMFRLPGASGWAVASGLVVGFPAGAKITARLREKALVTRSEAERLTALSHMCSPFFLLAVVGVGFLHNARLGLLLAVIHYASAWLAGIAMRGKQPKPAPAPRGAALWRQALLAMREAHLRDGRAFGKLLGDAVTSSVQTLMMVGGYMMIFSVLIQVVQLSQLAEVWHMAASGLLALLQLNASLAPAWMQGLFEIHLGAHALGQLAGVPLMWQLAFIGALLGWGGLSAHAQVIGLHQKNDVRYVTFLAARCLHAGLALILTLVLWKPLHSLFEDVRPSFLWIDPSPAAGAAASSSLPPAGAWSYAWQLLLLLAVVYGVMLLLSLLLNTLQRRPRS